MNYSLLQQTQKAIMTERHLVECFHEMMENAHSEKSRAIIHDLILMEEMNEVLLRSLNQGMSA